MKRILILAVMAGAGYMFLNGLHLEDIDTIFARVKQQTGAAAPTFPTGPSLQPVTPGQPQPPVNGQPTIRIASFNIQTWGDSKAQKPYVQETIAQLIAQFDVVAIQEIRTQDEYFLTNFLRDYVNRGNQRQYAFVIGPRLGRSVSTEQYAFIYNAATLEVNPQVTFTMQDPQDVLHREPFVAMFRARGAPPEQAFTFMLVNIHTDPDVAKQEIDVLADVYDAIRRMPIGEDDVILLGDLNTDVPSSDPWVQPRTGRPLDPKDLGRLGQVAGIYPLVRNEATNTIGTKMHDNILIHRGATTEFTGRSGVVDVQRMFNLSVDQAKMVSDHRPIWGEFSAYESASPGRMAQQPGATAR